MDLLKRHQEHMQGSDFRVIPDDKDFTNVQMHSKCKFQHELEAQSGLVEDAKKLHATIEAVRAEKARVQLQLDAEEAKCSKAEKDRRRLKEANEALERDSEDTKALVRRSTQLAEENEAKLEKAERENTFLSDEVRRLNARCSALDNQSASNEEVTKLTRETHELKQQLVACKDETRDQRRLLKDAQDELQASKQQHRSSRRSVQLETEEKASARDRAQRKATALEEEVESLKSAMHKMQLDAKSHAEGLAHSSAAGAVHQRELDKTLEMLKREQETNRKLRDDIEAAKDDAHHTSSLRRESEMLHENVLQEKQTAETVRRSLSKAQSDAQKEREKARELQRELSRVREEHSEVTAEKEQQVQENQRIKADNLGDKNAIRILRNDLQHEAERTEKTEEANRSLRREVQQRKAETELVQRDVEHARTQVERLREKLLLAQMQSEGAPADTTLDHETQASLINATRLGSESIYVAQNQIKLAQEELEAQMEDLARKDAELEKTAAKLRQAHMRIETLEAMVEASSSVHEDLATWQAQVKTLQTEIYRLRSELEQAQAAQRDQSMASPRALEGLPDNLDSFMSVYENSRTEQHTTADARANQREHAEHARAAPESPANAAAENAGEADSGEPHWATQHTAGDIDLHNVGSWVDVRASKSTEHRTLHSGTEAARHGQSNHHQYEISLGGWENCTWTAPTGEHRSTRFFPVNMHATSARSDFSGPHWLGISRSRMTLVDRSANQQVASW